MHDQSNPRLCHIGGSAWPRTRLSLAYRSHNLPQNRKVLPLAPSKNGNDPVQSYAHRRVIRIWLYPRTSERRPFGPVLHDDMRFPGIVLTAFLPVVLATTDSLRLHHRIYHPSLPSEPFTERGALLLADSGPAAKASLVHSDTLQADLSSFLQAAQNIPQKDNDGVLYQLALEHPGDTHHSQWHVSAVKACHLFQSTSETITLHLAVDGKPFAIDYFVTPIPHNGACPKKRRRSTVTKSDSPDVPGAPSFALGLNSTVLVRAPTFPPL
ncbi:hypothetical protein EW026_g412 [Hermanssonia centrifuga]|uniref:Uncharacterized protein n=1 Tax=Hermanssonia centrifuga TaxID=98765 RepID=A0A4V3XBK6_9APHY|nr:hypothetical protein EW026_g412 [Hermanssonia centrifuga]